MKRDNIYLKQQIEKEKKEHPWANWNTLIKIVSDHMNKKKKKLK